jgi:hypothetical protein
MPDRGLPRRVPTTKLTDQKRCCDEGFYDENSCTQIVDEPLNLFMGKINKYITISVASKFIYGVLIPHRNIASSFQLTGAIAKRCCEAQIALQPK